MKPTLSYSPFMKRLLTYRTPQKNLRLVQYINYPLEVINKDLFYFGIVSDEKNLEYYYVGGFPIVKGNNIKKLKAFLILNCPWSKEIKVSSTDIVYKKPILDLHKYL